MLPPTSSPRIVSAPWPGLVAWGVGLRPTAAGLLIALISNGCAAPPPAARTTDLAFQSIEQTGRIKVSDYGVRAVGFSSDGATLFTADAAGNLRSFESRTGRPLGPAVNHGYRSQIAFAPSGSLAVVATGYSLRMVDPVNGRTLRAIRIISRYSGWHSGGLVVSADGSTAVMNTAENSVTAVGLSLGHLQTVDRNRRRSLPGLPLAISGNGEWAAFGDIRIASLAIWNSIADAVDTFDLRSLHGVRAATFYPDGKHLLVFTRDGERLVIELTTMTRRFISTAKRVPEVNVVAASPAGEFFVTGHNDGSLAFWLNQTHRLGFASKAHVGPITSLAFSPDGNWLATVGADRQVTLWDLTALRGVELAARQP